METTAEIPRVNNRWNNEQLLQEALQLILNGQVEYGYVNKAREIIKLKSTMIKSPEQIQAVRNSPEFLRCTEQIKLGQLLSHVCEITRHQATSIDEIRSELIIPTYLTKYSIIPNVAGMVKSLLIGNLIEHPSNHVSVESVKIVTKVCNQFRILHCFHEFFTDALPLLEFFSVKKTRQNSNDENKFKFSW